jgi:hypothetical protein
MLLQDAAGGVDSNVASWLETPSSSNLSTALAGDVIPIANLASGTPDGTKFIRDDGTLAVPAGGSGTVTSVAVSGSDGIEVDSGSPITTSGTIALGVNASTLKTHLSLNNVENTAISTWAGSANIATVGTVTAGTWQGDVIAEAYLENQSGTNTGDEISATTSAEGIVEIATQAEVNTGTDASRVVTCDTLNGWDGTGQNEVLGIAVSDETTDLTTGTAKATFRMPYAMTLSEVRATVTTAPVGSTLVVDLNEGTTILSTKLSIDASEKTSETAATPAVISDSALADDAEITIDIDQVGASTAGTGLKIWLIGTRA